MDDETCTKRFALEVSTICPRQGRWPRPDVEFRTKGDAITAKGLHWSRIHDAVDWLRDSATKALTDIAAIYADENLSPRGKADKKKRIAIKVKAIIEKSKAVAQAKETSAKQLAKWDREFEAHLKQATTTHDAAVYSELWNRCYRMQGAERLAWLNKYATDPTFASALLTAPAAVTGLKSEECHFLRERFEKVVDPDAAEERPLTLEALDDLDKGARNAINKVCQAASVKADELSSADAEQVDEAA